MLYRDRASRVVLVMLAALFLASCAAFQPRLEQPVVKVTGLSLLPSQGFQQRIGVGLSITNPNSQDLSVKGISYTIGIENFPVLSGVTSQVPLLKAYEETPVSLEVSANLLEVVRLAEYFSRRGVATEGVKYNVDAKLDFSRWLPAMRIRETGVVPLSQP